MKTSFVAALLILLVGTARASLPGAVIQSARTIVHGVHDSVVTVGRTAHAFVFGGPDAAGDAWWDNVELTREHARRNADRALEEAGVTRRPEPEPFAPPPPDDDY